MPGEFHLTEKPLPSNKNEETFDAQIEASLRTESPEDALEELIYRWFGEDDLDEGEALGVLHRFFQRELRRGDREADYTVVADTMDALVGWGVGPKGMIRRPLHI